MVLCYRAMTFVHTASLPASVHRWDLVDLAADDLVVEHACRSHLVLLPNVDHIVRSMLLPPCSISDKNGISMGSVRLSTAPLLQKLCDESSNPQSGGLRACP